MPVVEAVQTFVGIANENEFYSHHYLSEVLKGDIKERLEQWATAEEAHPEQRAPYKQLASWASQWFALRNTVSHDGTAAEQLDSFRHVQQGLLQALGYTITPQHLELQAGMPVPVWQVIGDASKAPQVLVVPAYNPGQEEDDILDQRLSAVHYAGVPVPPALADADVASIVSDGLFGADMHPGSSSWWASRSGSCSIASSGPTAALCVLTGARFLTARTRLPCRPRPRYCTGTRWLLTAAPVC
jgi:hypothetical protein